MTDRYEGPQYPANNLGLTNPAKVVANIMRRTAELEAGIYSSSGPMEMGGGRYRVDAMRPGTMVTMSDPSIESAAQEFVVGASQGGTQDAWGGVTPRYGPAASGEKYRAAGYQPMHTQVTTFDDPATAAHRVNVLSPAARGSGRMLGEPRAAEFADSYGRSKAR